jgi:DNA-binding transcriptional ArsR family regulator
MPSLDVSPELSHSPTLPLVVKPSLVCELVWAMSLQAPEGEEPYPARAGRFSAHADVEDRIRGFWGDGQDFFTEVLVVADRAGAFFEEDPERLFERLELAAEQLQRPEPLGSEHPDDQRRFRARLKRLRERPHVRREWIDLIRTVWEAVGPAWEARGRMTAEARSREYRQKLPGSLNYVELESLFHCDYDGMMPKVFRELAATGGEVVLVPAHFGRKGMFVAFPERMVVSPPTPTLPAGPTPETRSRARRFKALGDPTRLALLEAVGRRPRTVGELAELIGLAQPTVSNHVRVLREAGLLVAGRDGDRRLEPDVPALEHLFKEASGVVAGEHASAG